MNNNQWIRKAGLFLFNEREALDLSELHFKFDTEGAQVESPNSAVIRIYNLSKQTLDRVTVNGEFNQISLNAGYLNGNYGVIFQGYIKQFKIGKENATDTYLDIFAADGDIQYNQGTVNTTLTGNNNTPAKIIEAIGQSSNLQINDYTILTDKQHVPNIRGTVLFGMARARLRNIITSLDATWSIQEGKLVIIENTGYLPGEAVQINVSTGLVGVPEQTDSGIKIRSLLNSNLRIGGLVQLNNNEINTLMQQNPDMAPIPYDQWTGFQNTAALSPTGTYMVFSVKHSGDTRGQEWYSNLICLAVDITSPINNSVAPQ